MSCIPTYRFHTLVAAVIVFPVLVAGIEAEADEGADGPLAGYTPKQRQRLLAGKPVFSHAKGSAGEGANRGSGRAAVVVEAPIDTCFEIFGDLGQQYLYFPRKTRSDVIASQGNRRWVRTEVDFSVKTIVYTVRYTIDRSHHRFDFALDKRYPHDIAELSGHFRFERIDDRRTLLTYVATELDSGFAVPGFIEKYVTSRDLPAQVVNVKKRIESGGSWTK